jgi:hypothetical protein
VKSPESGAGRLTGRFASLSISAAREAAFIRSEPRLEGAAHGARVFRPPCCAGARAVPGCPDPHLGVVGGRRMRQSSSGPRHHPFPPHTVLSAGSPQELPAESSPPRATGGARPPPLYGCRRSRGRATKCSAARTKEVGLALSNPVRDRAAEGQTGPPPNEHETSTRDRRRSDEQDCLPPGWPASSPGEHPHGVTCRSDDPGSRLLHDRR